MSRVSFLGHQAKVDFSRLKGFHLHFWEKNGEWHDLLLGFQVTFVSPFHSDKNNQTCRGGGGVEAYKIATYMN